MSAPIPPTLGSVAGIALHSDIRTQVHITFSVPPQSTDDALALADAITQLGPTALAILAVMAQRLADGARQYADKPGGGDFSPTRDYRREEFEELLDARVYQLAGEVLKR